MHDRSRRQFLRLASGALAAGATGCAGTDTAKPAATGPDTPGADSGGADTGAPDDTGDPGPAAPTRAPEPAARWAPDTAEDPALFPVAVALGDAADGRLHVRVRSTAPTVRLRWALASGDAWEEQPATAEQTLHEGAVAHSFVIEGVPADVAGCVCAETPDGLRSAVSRFRSATAPGTARQVVFGATSCFGGNEPWASLSVAASEDLDFFCLLGDTVYADGSVDLADYRLHWSDAVAVQGLADLARSTSLVATWDDHEVDNNWEAASLDADQLAAAVAAMRETLPIGDGEGPAGIWRQLRWGDTLEVFVLDCRGERSGAQYISEAQPAWLAAALEASEARFKIILNSVPITDLQNIFGGAGASDRWEGHPEQRTAVLQHIADAGIPGVLWVTGDVHYAQVGRVDDEGGPGADQWEVFTGPAGSFLNVAADLYEGHPQYTWMAAVHNWCRFTCDPLRGTVLVEHVDDAGAVLHRIELAL